MMDSPDRPGDEPTLSGEEWVEYGGRMGPMTVAV
jgi:hypothetical protein